MKKTSMKKRICASLISLLICVSLLIGCFPAINAAPSNPFTDVKANAYYYNAVLWALNNNITTGTTSTTFSPDAPCTRGQIVAFLYRSAGQPSVSASSVPFTDVKKGAYYYNAVLWAVKNNITTGTTPTTFSPDAPCTRGQIVAFLYRSAEQPSVSASSVPFTDVKKGAYYYNAVLWAVKNNITTGTTPTTFSPDAPCTRGQIVTFLYRYITTKLTVVSGPKDYQMSSSQEVASFEIKVSGGVAPYSYHWFVVYDAEEIDTGYLYSEQPIMQFNWGFTDYDFDTCRDIVVYCIVTDANGNTVTSDPADVLPYYSMYIKTQPADYQMTSSQEDATFTVEIGGGVAPYTYQWVICYDNTEVTPSPAVSNTNTDTFQYRFTDYDFDDYHNIGVYCVITDAVGKSVTTNLGNVLPK